jgi:hypothetical protein
MGSHSSKKQRTCRDMSLSASSKRTEEDRAQARSGGGPCAAVCVGTVSCVLMVIARSTDGSHQIT